MSRLVGVKLSLLSTLIEVLYGLLVPLLVL